MLRFNGSCDLRVILQEAPSNPQPMLRALLMTVVCGAAVLTVGQTTLYPGDLAVIGVNANNTCIATTADEISFVCFKNITTNTQLDLTDNGYERQFAGQWGEGEGLFRLVRTGGTITAGTVITLRVNSGSSAPIFVSPDANWSVTVPAGYPAGNWFNMNAGGDQLFFTQGGTWTNPAGANNMTFNGSVLYGFSTVAAPNDWVSFQNSTQRSGIPAGMICFSMSPTSTSDYAKFVPFEFPGAYISRTQRLWIIEIDDVTKWNSYANCTLYNTYNAAAPASTYSPTWVGAALPMTAGTFVNGRWTGAKGTDWFDCRNWDDAEVPTATSNVVINSTYAPANSCVIGLNPAPPTASCATLQVTSPGAAKTLTIQNGGVLQVGGAVTIGNTGVSAFNGVILGNGATDGNITATSLTLSGTGTSKGGFRSEQVGNTAAIGGDITINAGGYLDLQGGVSGGTISLTGNYSNNDAITAFDETGSTVIFNGTGPQSINTSGFQEEYGYVTMNKSANDLTLNAPISVKSTLTMTSGRMMTSDPGGLLTLTNTASVSGANDAAPSFVHGPMVKIGTSNFTFPVGKGTRLHPASITNLTAGATDAFIAEYFGADPNLDIGTPIETPPLDHISSCEYWKLDQYSGTPLGRVTLSWKAPTSCGVTNVADLRVAKWDGSMWRDRGGVGFGTVSLGTIPQADPQEPAFLSAANDYWTLASVSTDNPLPIELLWFDARRDGSEVRLDWATASERNNDYFTVERSADGHTFTDVIRVDGAGNSTTTLNYSDYDHWPLPGTSFYRLRQTDFDGATAVSDMVAVKMPGKGGNGLVVLNEPERLIALHDFEVGSRIEVLDMTGRLVWQSRVETEERSFVPIAQLGTGAYVLRVSDDLRAESVPFVR